MNKEKLFINKNKNMLAQLVECLTLDRKVAGLNHAREEQVHEQDTSSSLLSIGSTQENVAT